MIRNGEVEGANALRALETIERNARSQARLIDDLLDVSRIITGNLRLDLNPLNLTPIVEAAVDALRPTADVKDIQLRTEFISAECFSAGRSESFATGDLEPAVERNQATSRGGKVSFELRCVESNARLTVSDTGEGGLHSFCHTCSTVSGRLKLQSPGDRAGSDWDSRSFVIWSSCMAERSKRERGTSDKVRRLPSICRWRRGAQGSACARNAGAN